MLLAFNSLPRGVKMVVPLAIASSANGMSEVITKSPAEQCSTIQSSALSNPWETTFILMWVRLGSSNHLLATNRAGMFFFKMALSKMSRIFPGRASASIQMVFGMVVSIIATVIF